MRPLTPLFLSILAGCSAPPPASRQSAVVYGIADDGDPAVVAVGDATAYVCTGSLVGKRAVLTAAHCPVVAGGLVGFGRFSGDLTDRGIAAVVRAGGWPDGGAGDDAALLFLDEDAPGATAPLPLDRRPLDDAAVGSALRVVGFGVDESGIASRKRSGNMSLAALAATTFDGERAPAQTCRGDSGGPALLARDGVEAIVGITADGDAECRAWARDARIDRLAGAFVDPTLAVAGAAGTVALGDGCVLDGNCTTGLCRHDDGSDRPGRCALPCASNGCAATDVCRPDDVGRASCAAMPLAAGCSSAGDTRAADGLSLLVGCFVVAASRRRRRSCTLER